jgi:hypothetical protein
MEQHPYCSIISQEAGEPLYGTASPVKVWFLLEYNRPWGAKATEENELPTEIQHWLQQQMKEVENGRLQFIRQQTPPGGITFFVLVTHETSPRLYRFRLESYADLVGLDIPGIVAGQTAFHAYLDHSLVYLVCTNARRDRCCGVFGAALYRPLSALLPGQVWQTTHLGGHRFAPTLLTVPDGVYYGRISPDNLPQFITTTQQGQLYLPGYRGRTCYSEPVQAAEYYLRQQTGPQGTTGYHLLSAQQTETEWVIIFQHIGTASTHTIHLQPEAVVLPIYASCGKPETKPIIQYRLSSSL